MTVSIIIRTKDEEGNIGQVLKTIFSQDIENKFEVIIVDSGSSDRTLDIASQYNVKIVNIPASKFSYGYSLNYGIQNSSGEIICCLSAHCIPYNNNWLSELIKPIKEGGAHAVFGRQVPVNGINPFEEVSLNKHFPEDEVKVGRIPFSNANCAFLRVMWDEVRFDEIIPSWEDYLWYLLTKDRFVFRYTPSASVYHSHPFSIRSTALRAFRDGQAFKYINGNYKFDVMEEIPSKRDKFLYFLLDISRHVNFFFKKRYLSSLLITPFVRALVYFNYLRGYNSKSLLNQ